MGRPLRTLNENRHRGFTGGTLNTAMVRPMNRANRQATKRALTTHDWEHALDFCVYPRVTQRLGER